MRILWKLIWLVWLLPTTAKAQISGHYSTTTTVNLRAFLKMAKS